MQQTIVRVICAIGQSGQMGLKGHLPWEGNRSPEYKADVARFFEITRGHVLAAGPKTISSVPEFARWDRDLIVLRSSMGRKSCSSALRAELSLSAAVPLSGMFMHRLSAIGISRGCLTTVPPTAGSILNGLHPTP